MNTENPSAGASNDAAVDPALAEVLGLSDGATSTVVGTSPATPANPASETASSAGGETTPPSNVEVPAVSGPFVVEDQNDGTTLFGDAGTREHTLVDNCDPRLEACKVLAAQEGLSNAERLAAIRAVVYSTTAQNTPRKEKINHNKFE